MNTIYKEVKPFTTAKLLITIDKAVEFAKGNKFEMKGEVSSSYKEEAAKKADLATFTMKKKLNKIIRRLEYKMTRKNINLFFHFLNKRLELNMTVKFGMSKEEESVVYAKEDYKLLRQQTEDARKKYILLKRGYYGSGKPNTEYMEN